MSLLCPPQSHSEPVFIGSVDKAHNLYTLSHHPVPVKSCLSNNFIDCTSDDLTLPNINTVYSNNIALPHSISDGVGCSNIGAVCSNTIALPQSISDGVSCSGLIIAFHNIRSICNKMLDVLLAINQYNIDIFCLAETWLHSMFPTALLQFNGFKIHRLDRPTHGGGVLVLVRNSIMSHIENTIMNGSIELIHVSITIKCSKPINIICVYKPPNASVISFYDSLYNFLCNIDYSHLPVIIMGDINIDIKASKASGSISFVNFLKDFGLSICNKKPTRVTNNTASLIDVIVCNLISKSYVNDITNIITPYSDHDMLLCGYKKPKPSNNVSKTIQKMVLTDDTANTVYNYMCNLHININSQDTDFVFNSYYHDLMHIISTIPVKNYIIKSSQHPWINSHIIKIIHSRNFWINKSRKTNNPSHILKAAFYGKLCKSKCIQAQKDYYHQKLDYIHGNNPKKSWRIINSLIKDSKPTPTSIKVDGIMCHDHGFIANHFNSFFISIIDDLKTNFTVPHLITPNIVPVNNVVCSFNFCLTDYATVYIILSKITKGNNYDYSIHHIIIARFIDILSLHLTILFNQIVVTNKFPSIWKVANVIPILKSGSPLDVANYRPISILPNISKVVERVLYNQIYKFLVHNNIISDSQHGFVTGKSTQTCCTELTSYIFDSLDKNLVTVAIFLDLSKAFDMIDHNILLDKLAMYGFSYSALALLKSYISGRSQKITIDDASSTCKSLYYGVPQGSILGPLLFIIYINDLPNYIKFSKVLLYADDTTLVYAHKDVSTVFDNVNHDLSIFHSFCTNNGLIANPTKSKAMFFYNRLSHHNHNTFYLNNAPVDVANEFTFLGLKIDSKLTFMSHVSHVCSKLSAVNFIIYKLRLIFNKHDLNNIFSALGLSHIYYCDTIYLHACNAKSFNQIRSKYVDCGRNIINNRFGVSSTNVLEILGWVDLCNTLQNHLIVFVYKCINDIYTTPNLKSMLRPITHTHSTRGNLNAYNIPHVSSNKGKLSFYYWGPKIWNGVSAEVKSCNSLLSLKSILNNDN